MDGSHILKVRHQINQLPEVCHRQATALLQGLEYHVQPASPDGRMADMVRDYPIHGK
jgi:hypothetical protein